VNHAFLNLIIADQGQAFVGFVGKPVKRIQTRTNRKNHKIDTHTPPTSFNIERLEPQNATIK